MSQSDRELLARWRQIGARHSADVVEIAPKILQAGVKGEEEWAVREQLAFAALDMGMVDWATDQIRALKRQFPGSPRVGILSGMRLEAMGSVDEARGVYESILAKDETNTSAHQRLISLSLPLGPSHSIPLLLTYLDTYYTDASAWSLLADLYCEAGLYGQGLAALGHVMVVQGWDTGAVSRAGGVAYTMGDYQLSLKYYLRAIEMSTPPKPTSSQIPASTRDWWGVRQCTKRLLDNDPSGVTSLPPDTIIPQEKLRALQALATERILSVGGEDMGIRRKVLGEQSIVR